MNHRIHVYCPKCDYDHILDRQSEKHEGIKKDMVCGVCLTKQVKLCEQCYFEFNSDKVIEWKFVERMKFQGKLRLVAELKTEVTDGQLNKEKRIS